MSTPVIVEKPLYREDRTDSIYLGTHMKKDLYFTNENDLIIRCGNEVWDSFIMKANEVKELMEANSLMKNSPLITCYKRYLEYIKKHN